MPSSNVNIMLRTLFSNQLVPVKLFLYSSGITESSVMFSGHNAVICVIIHYYCD